MEQPVNTVVKRPKGSRPVILLKNDDCERKAGKVYLPTTIEMARIKKPHRGQYQYVKFSNDMDEEMVKDELQKKFPAFDLKNGRFSCAAVSQDSITYQFHGTPCVWDGQTIKKRIKGNSVLYIIMDYDQVSHQQSRLYTATEGGGSSTDTYQYMNPGNNTICQTEEQTNPMNIDVPLADGQTLFHETPLVIGTDMEVDDSKEGNEDELDVHNPFISSVDQMSSDSSGIDNLLSYSDTQDFTSGISESGAEPDDWLYQWTTEFVPLQVESVTPNKVPLQGGNLCCFTFSQPLPRNVQSGFAMFGPLGTVDVNRCGDDSLVGKKIPPAQEPGWVTVTLKSNVGIPLGEIKILYVDEEKVLVQRLVNEPRLLCKLFRELGVEEKTISEGETQDSGYLDFTNPVHVLRLLVYAAAESGAQQFIEMIFNSSAGRIVFDAYKDRPLLPEVIAKSHGNEETAYYLEEISKRFSEEITTGKECSQTIDWSELVKAAEAAEKRLDLTSRKGDDKIEKDIPKETGYLGDIDTSSSESSEAQSSDSDDDSSRTSKKESQIKAGESKQPFCRHEDHPTEVNKANQIQRRNLFLKDGEFPRGKANVKLFYETKPLRWKENGLHLTQASHFQEAHNLRQLNTLHRSGIPFLLDLGNEPVQYHLITAYQRVGYLLTSTRERNAYCKKQVGTAKAHQSLEHSSTIPGNKADHKSCSMNCLQQIYCGTVNEELEFQHECYLEFTATDNIADPTVRQKSAECLMEHCQSAAFDFLVLSSVFHTTRKILIVYVADNKDVFPFVSCDDQQYELSWQHQQCQRCKNNVRKFQEICNLSELKNSQLDPPLFNSQATHVTKVVCKEQSYVVDDQPFDVVGKLCLKDLFSVHKSKNFERDWHEEPFLSISQTKKAHNTESTDHLYITSHPHKEAQKVNGDVVVLVSKSWPSLSQFHYMDEVGVSSICPEINPCAEIAQKDLEDVADNKDVFPFASCDDRLCTKKANNDVTVYQELEDNKTDVTGGLEETASSFDSLFNSHFREVWRPKFSFSEAILNHNESYLREDSANHLGDGLANNTSIATLNLKIGSSDESYLREHWAKDLGDYLAKNTSITTLTLTINSSDGSYWMEDWRKDWAKGLADGLAKNTSITTLTLTINSSDRSYWMEDWRKDWEKGLADGLAKNTSITTLNLTINGNGGSYLSEHWAKGLADGLAKNTSIATLNLTINGNGRSYLSEHWAKSLADGLAKNTSITTLTLTININGESYLRKHWAKYLADGLAKNTSITTLNLTINSNGQSYLSEDCAKGLGDGLAKNTSITTFNLTINRSGRSYRRIDWKKDWRKDWTKDLADGLAKNTSITTFNLTINSKGGSYVREHWAKDLGDGLAKNTSITTFNLTINSNGESYLSEDWAKGLADGLAKNTSITSLSLTININGKKYFRKHWAKRLTDSLAKNTSITSLSLTININGKSYLREHCAKHLADSLAKNKSITIFNPRINSNSESYLREDWAKCLADGLARNTSLTTLYLIVNNRSDSTTIQQRFNNESFVTEDWMNDLGKGLAKSTSLRAVTVTVNGNSYSGEELTNCLGHSLSKSSSSPLVTLCNDSKPIKSRNWKIANDRNAMFERPSHVDLSSILDSGQIPQSQIL